MFCQLHLCLLEGEAEGEAEMEFQAVIPDAEEVRGQLLKDTFPLSPAKYGA